jgi:biotin carboxylase
MSVLIMHRGTFRTSPYQRWMEGYDGDAVVLASQEQLAAHGERLPAATGRFRHTEEIADYDHGALVARRAAQLIEQHGLRRVVAVGEVDIGRAAALRERYGMPGQDPAGAAVYRDKWLMKKAAEAAGIPVARHRLVSGAGELAAFTADHGLPVVVKPRTGAGSIGLAVLRDAEDTRRFLAAREAAGDYLDPAGEVAWLAERFVPGSMFHIDGVVLEGRVVTLWPSHYRYALAAFAEDLSGRRDVALAPDDPLTGRLTAFGERVLAAFGGPADFSFHIEVFRTPQDELVLCEAACRPGGAGIRDMHRAMFGLDPAETMVRAQLGLPPDAKAGGATAVHGARLRPRQLAAQLLFMKRAGTVHALPADDPARFPWVLRSQLFAARGDRLGAAEHSGDFLLAYVLAAPDGGALELRLDELESWCAKGLDVR